LRSSGRVDYLDGLRAVAILSVLALHWLVWYAPFFRGGAVGVDVFFVLSGFIITTMLWRSPVSGSLRGAYGSFVRRRITRLYPALLGLVLGCVLIYWLVPASGVAPDEVARRGLLALAQSTSVWGATQEGTFLVPTLEPFGITWSLAVEWYFYLLWPLLLLGARRRGWTARRAAIVSLVVGTACYLLSLPLDPFWFYFGPSARFGEILAGCSLALWMQAGSSDTPTARIPATVPWLALAVLCLYVLLGPESDSSMYRWVGVPLAVAATLVLIRSGYSAAGGPVHALLTSPALTYVGRLSYSLYLWHLVPILVLEEVPGVPKPVLGVLALASTAALTLGSYYLLERPFLRSRSDVLLPGGTSRSAPRSSRRSSRSSADVRLWTRPIRVATSLRRTASRAPEASTSARKLANGSSSPTSSPGSQSSTSAGANERLYVARSGTQNANGRSSSRKSTQTLE
jgi:peptidoglycan/LPS O-acetylase OafA/YrhL